LSIFKKISNAVRDVGREVREVASDVYHQPLKTIANTAVDVYTAPYTAAKSVLDKTGVTDLPIVGNVAGLAGNLSEAGKAVVSGQGISPQLRNDIIEGGAVLAAGYAGYQAGNFDSVSNFVESDLTKDLVSSFIQKGGYANSTGAELPKKNAPVPTMFLEEPKDQGFDMTPLFIGGAIAAAYFLLRRK